MTRATGVNQIEKSLTFGEGEPQPPLSPKSDIAFNGAFNQHP